VIVLFYDKLEPLLEVLSRHGALPVSSIEGLAAHAAQAAASASTRPLEAPPAVAPAASNVAAPADAERRPPFVPRCEPLAATGQLPRWR